MDKYDVVGDNIEYSPNMDVWVYANDSSNVHIQTKDNTRVRI